MLLQLLKRSLPGRRARARASEAAADAKPVTYSVEQVLAAMEARQWSSAEALLRARVDAVPQDPDAWSLLAVTLLERNAPEEAVAVVLAGLQRFPGRSELLFHLGLACSAGGDYKGARKAFENLVVQSPDSLPGWINAAMACKVLGDLGAAEGALRRALALAPESGEAWHNLGSVLADVGGRMRDAIAAFDQAIALGHPAVAETRMSRALALLAAGDLKRGWEEIDVRLELSRWRGDVRPYCIPFWKGEPLEGRSILVWGEQGVGDELLYASLYAELIAQVSACIIECRDKLVPLMQRSFPSARILTWRQPGDPGNAEGIDYQIPIASLGRYLRPTLGSFPVHDGYLRADPQRVAYWQRRLHGLGTGARIGFSWRSGDSSGERALACTDLSQWRCLFARASATFVCLQYDECAAEIEALRRAGHANVVRFPEVDYFDDLDEVAALMEALDLVVSAPNAVSIEAAALGVPTWQLGYGMDWQCLGTEANPWFPAMRRFERKWNESWDEVLQRVAENLDAFLSARPANARL